MLSATESAEILDISSSRVRALIKSGQLPAKKNGREWVLREEDVLQRLAKKPNAGRPKNQGSETRGESPSRPRTRHELHDIYEKCKKTFSHLPDQEIMVNAQSEEEAAFYMAVSDFFLQQAQASLVKAGVY